MTACAELCMCTYLNLRYSRFQCNRHGKRTSPWKSPTVSKFILSTILYAIWNKNTLQCFRSSVHLGRYAMRLVQVSSSQLSGGGENQPPRHITPDTNKSYPQLTMSEMPSAIHNIPLTFRGWENSILSRACSCSYDYIACDRQTIRNGDLIAVSNFWRLRPIWLRLHLWRSHTFCNISIWSPHFWI